MQSPAVKTPVATKRAGVAATNKSSGKKLVQARLPFKIISSGISTAAAGGGVALKEKEEDATKDGRKRKLSFDGEQNETEKSGSDVDALRERSASKENLTVSSKKKKIAADNVDDIILLDDDDIAEEEDEPPKLDEEKNNDGDNTITTNEIKENNDQAPKNKNKLKAVKGESSGSKVCSPRTRQHKETILKDVETPKSKEAKGKKTETPKTKEVKGKKSETPKAKEVKGKKVGTPNVINSPHTPPHKDMKGKSSKTPKPKVVDKQQPDTPNSTKSKKATTPGSAKTIPSDLKASSSATKVQIKLPLGSAKVGKRRKSKISLDAAATEIILSSDENEANPVKKPKIDRSRTVHKNEGDADKATNNEADKMSTKSLDDSSTTESEGHSNVLVLEIGGNEETDVIPDSELDSRCSSMTVVSKDTASKHASPAKKIETIDNKTKGTDSLKLRDALDKKIGTTQIKSELETNSTETIFSNKSKNDLNPAREGNCEKNKITQISEPTGDKHKRDIEKNYADTSIVIKSSSSDSDSSAHTESKSNAEQSAAYIIGTPKIIKEDQNKSLKKTLTPKQMKLMEQRRKAREEKERKLQEERLQKQREKEAKELERKREREEREELRRKEREEKDEQKRKEREERDEVKRKEREEKERKRLAEQEVKNEEKRKRNEAKEEELRKKEEERKRKEEADLKAKKVAEAFQKFFKTKRASNGEDGDAAQQTNRNESYDSKSLAFRPFEVKGDMKMAPICRKQLSQERRAQLDEHIGDANGEAVVEKQELYLAELKCGKIIPGIWRSISVDTKVSDDDVQIIDDELDRAGQAIVEETHAPIEHFRTKFYKFHENRRPPYYGTWRKRTNVIKARRPFVQDTTFFDYEVDSDLEWEDEEPGESLDGSDDEKEKESEDDDYEVDNEWFVPHGHLSEEEMQNEDDDANTREAQKAKLQVLQQEFAQEMKKKTEKIKPRLIGCIWTDENGNQPTLCPKIIWDILNNRAMLCEAPPLLEDAEVPEKVELGSPTSNLNEKTVEKIKPIKITETMLNDLVRLVHGNHHSKNFLIKEFIAYLEASEESIKNGEVRGPIKSLVREKIDDFAEWTITESTKMSQKNKKKNKKHLCWVVSADVLKRMGLESLDLHNTWKYTLQPKTGTDLNSTKPDKEGNADTNAKAVDACFEKKNESKSTPKVTKTNKMSPSNTITQKSSTSGCTDLKKKPPKDEAKASREKMPTDAATAETATVKAKKRVPLLMSVARGQQISQPTKNALISEFLKKSNAEKVDDGDKTARDSQTSSATPGATSEVVELD
ncbi:chromatin assembly factor 1 subunit A [Eurosta solidaginis]|uniref:chromatin assembly factor 1 subunit A n=1 Tax=Eurosta solidaginis TaxID=178769 RepID=UPI0035307135